MRASLLPVVLLLSTPLSAQATYDARIVESVGMRYACDGEIVPVLKIINDGNSPMSGCVVETWKNSVFVGSFDWQLAVPSVQGEVRQPAFPAVQVVAGDVVQMRIISVNGEPDENADGNVWDLEIEPDPAVAMSYVVEVHVQAAATPGSVTWSIADRSAVVVATSGSIPLGAGEEHSTWLDLLPAACYTLVVRDESGGLAGGTVSLNSLDVPVAVIDAGDVVPEARSGFTTGTVARSAQLAEPGLGSYPSPTSGPFMIDVGSLVPGAQLHLWDMTGRCVYTANLSGPGPFRVDPGALEAGRYVVEVRNGASTLRSSVLVQPEL